MSTVCVLTPIVIGSWPMIATAVAGAASAMGFTVLTPECVQQKSTADRKSVETEVPNSEIVEELMERGEKIRIQRDEVVIEFGRDERGACTVCVSGSLPKRQLEEIGQEVAGRVVQQFAYHKLMTELKNHNYEIVDERVQGDESIQVRVRLGS